MYGSCRLDQGPTRTRCDKDSRFPRFYVSGFLKSTTNTRKTHCLEPHAGGKLSQINVHCTYNRLSQVRLMQQDIRRMSHTALAASLATLAAI